MTWIECRQHNTMCNCARLFVLGHMTLGCLLLVLGQWSHTHTHHAPWGEREDELGITMIPSTPMGDTGNTTLTHAKHGRKEGTPQAPTTRIQRYGAKLLWVSQQSFMWDSNTVITPSHILGRWNGFAIPTLTSPTNENTITTPGFQKTGLVPEDPQPR